MRLALRESATAWRNSTVFLARTLADYVAAYEAAAVSSILTTADSDAHRTAVTATLSDLREQLSGFA